MVVRTGTVLPGERLEKYVPVQQKWYELVLWCCLFSWAAKKTKVATLLSYIIPGGNALFEP